MAYLCHLLTPRAEARLLDGNQLGIFAISPISVGTVIAVCGSMIHSSDVLDHMPQEHMRTALQIEDNLLSKQLLTQLMLASSITRVIQIAVF